MLPSPISRNCAFGTRAQIAGIAAASTSMPCQPPKVPVKPTTRSSSAKPRPCADRALLLRRRRARRSSGSAPFGLTRIFASGTPRATSESFTSLRHHGDRVACWKAASSCAASSASCSVADAAEAAAHRDLGAVVLDDVRDAELAAEAARPRSCRGTAARRCRPGAAPRRRPAAGRAVVARVA